MAKALCTDLGHRSADEALPGIKQTVRDSRIALNYEGSNETQAVGLVRRNLLDDGGAGSDALLQEPAYCAGQCG